MAFSNFKNKQNVSLFLRYLRNGEVLPRKPHMMNSSSKKEDNYINKLRRRIELSNTEESISNDFKTRSKYDYNVPNTNMTVRRDLIHLTNLEENIFYFVEQFRETVTLTGWDSQTALSVLHSIIADNIRKQIITIKDCDLALEHILKLKYKKELTFYYNDFWKNYIKKTFTRSKIIAI
ncbi:hypothetical protein H312_00066 [Anncaliia algerae PRA339]|uniref:Uncharacterized protein n=1 Tax=Anncaliia algerae PRA339 TaxID=1288291 RepID=A0A059F531_9MICR|nr:hypothetical protein H312_00066 [Anncaliia algerae PRA339]